MGAMQLDRKVCYAAVKARDRRFDGRFYTCVASTGTVCRPICPVPPPKLENCTFLPSAAAALAAGYRPCLRCRPEVAPGIAGWRGTANTVNRGLALIAEGALVEWARVHGKRYGTAHHTVEDGLMNRALTIFDIDVQGGEQIAAAYPEAITVWISAPSREQLELRLRGRNTDSDEEIARRLEAASEEERLGLRHYRYHVINGDLESALVDLKAILRAERCKM